MDLPDVDNPEEFRCISLFTGYAGIELGIRRVVPALRTVAYVEVEAFACANLVAKMEAGYLDAAPIWTDIKTFDGRPFYKRVHIITAGYPCQGESCAGKRQGKDDPRWLWPYIESILETVRPVWFFGENVSGHLSLGFPTVYRSLRNLGYKVEAGLFTAEECGAPHRRQRLFILAHRSDSRCENVQIQQEGQSVFGQGCRSMANSKSGTRQIHAGPRPEGTREAVAGWAGELADTECAEQGQGTIKETPAESGGDRLAIGGLADTGHKGPQGSGYTIQRGRSFITGNIGYLSSTWPSRPGQPQYEWEEPRVIDHLQHRRHEQKKGQIQTGRDRVKHTDEGQAQSRLGRAANGTSSRVDRLRLLGNGVVPQQAELAFRELNLKFETRLPKVYAGQV